MVPFIRSLLGSPKSAISRQFSFLQFHNFRKCYHNDLTHCLFYFSSFEYVVSAEHAVGSFENGSWNGVVGMLVRNVN